MGYLAEHQEGAGWPARLGIFAHEAGAGDAHEAGTFANLQHFIINDIPGIESFYSRSFRTNTYIHKYVNLHINIYNMIDYLMEIIGISLGRIP